MTARILGLLAALALGALNGAAMAAPSEAAAESRYDEGVAAYAAGRYADAVELFREVDRIEPTAAIAFDIARAAEKLGDDAAALAGYRDYLRRSSHPDDEAEVVRRIGVLDARLVRRGVQQLTVLSTPSRAMVTVDGMPVGVTAWTSELPLGNHDVLLRLDGHATAVRRVALDPKGAVDLDVTLEPDPRTAPPAPAAFPAKAPPLAASKAAGGPHDEARQGNRALSTVGIIALGAGGVALSGALAFEIVRKNAQSRAREEHEQVRIAEDIDTMKSSKTTSRVLLGVGVPLAIAGGVLVVVGARRNSTESRAPEVAFTATPTVFTTTFRGRF